MHEMINTKFKNTIMLTAYKFWKGTDYNEMLLLALFLIQQTLE